MRLISLFFSSPRRFSVAETMLTTPKPQPQLHHLPPHLREVCDILARGLVRLRRRTAEEFDRDLGAAGETSLHSTAHQSVHAVPLERTSA